MKSVRVCAALLLSIFVMSTASLQAETVVLTPIADTTISTTSPDTPGGANQLLDVGALWGSGYEWYWYSFVKFDLSSIPPDATITSASLELYVEDKTAGNLWAEAYIAPQAWSETGLTWNSWGIEEFPSGPWMNLVVTDTTGWCTFEEHETPAVVEAWLTGQRENHGFWIVQYSTNDLLFSFRSREAAEFRPKLTIDLPPVHVPPTMRV